MTLYKTVPVTEDNLPPVGESLFSDDYLMYKDDEFIGIGFYDRISNQWIGQHGIEKPTHYLLPVGEEKLRRLCEEVWDISAAYHSNIDEDIPDKQTAITELIKQYTEQ